MRPLSGTTFGRRLHGLFVGAAVGLVIGGIVGGTLGRIYMRLIFLAKDDTLGLQTAMGATVGDFTRPGTFAIFVFGAIAGTPLGIAYVATRGLLPQALRWRTTLFVAGTTAFLIGQIARANREDFTFVPITLSLILTALAVALTAIPIPALIDRYTYDAAPISPPPAWARVVVAAGMIGFFTYAVTGIAMAYAVQRV